MSTEVEQVPQVVNLTTGEVIALDAPDEVLGGYLADVRNLEAALREAKRLVSDELLARLDRHASWTINAPGMKISGQSPAKVETWDGAELRTALLQLVDDDVLSIEAVDAAVEQVVTFKPRKAGINKLRKLGGEVAAAVDGLAVESEPQRRITVTRV